MFLHLFLFPVGWNLEFGYDGWNWTATVDNEAATVDNEVYRQWSNTIEGAWLPEPLDSLCFFLSFSFSFFAKWEGKKENGREALTIHLT